MVSEALAGTSSQGPWCAVGRKPRRDVVRGGAMSHAALSRGRLPTRRATFSKAAGWIHVETSAPASEQLLRLVSGKPHLGHVRTGVEQFSVLRPSG